MTRNTEIAIMRNISNIFSSYICQLNSLCVFSTLFAYSFMRKMSFKILVHSEITNIVSHPFWIKRASHRRIFFPLVVWYNSFLKLCLWTQSFTFLKFVTTLKTTKLLSLRKARSYILNYSRTNETVFFHTLNFIPKCTAGQGT